MNKEEAIERIKILLEDECECQECLKNKEAYKFVLKELEALQDDLKIHEETSFEFQEENIKLRKELKNSIPKQVILDKIDEKKNRIDKLSPIGDCVLIDDLEIEINVLQEILKEN